MQKRQAENRQKINRYRNGKKNKSIIMVALYDGSIYLARLLYRIRVMKKH